MTGLTSEEARANLAEFGPNVIFKEKKIRFWDTFKEEVTEPMILLLIFVGVIYSILGKLGDAITIFAIIFTLVLVEVWNEYRAKKAINALEQLSAPKTKVMRDQKMVEIPSVEVVPGDLLMLSAGTKVAADAKVTRSINLQVDESPLTGESLPVDKNGGDEIYAGTTIISGEGFAEVFATGRSTKFGKIAETLGEVKPPRTPLQIAMRSLSQKLVYVAVFFSAFIPILGIIRGQDIRTMILTGLSLAFATIPEELPIVITMVLGLGSYKLSKNNFLIKKLRAAESLGNATVIVTDKTGTITEGRMSIVSIYPQDKERDVIEKAFFALSLHTTSPMEEEIKKKAQKLGIEEELAIARVRDIGNGRKTKSVVRKGKDGYEIFMSGAPEEIFRSVGEISGKVKEKLEEETSKGRRVIGVCYKKLGEADSRLPFDRIEKDMNFIGLISFEDPPRNGVKETINQVKRAHVRVIMVTGDHPLTATYIARQVGIDSDSFLTGEEVDRLTDDELHEVVREVSVFARTSPEHKYRIVKALQSGGEVVAVTGDGINDAIALKAADIGIAMGKKGTDVAKDAAEVVLADDNFITIARALFEGRKFFDNLRKGVVYYLSVKVALILIFLFPVLVGIPLPFAPIQIIILELFMDLAASAGFVNEPAERNIYERPPRNPKENLINRETWEEIFLKGGLLFVGVTCVYLYSRSINSSLLYQQTLAFSAWIFGHLFLAFFSRSERESIFSIGLFSNTVMNLWALLAVLFLLAGIYTGLRSTLFLSYVSPIDLIFVVIFMLVLIAIIEVRKILLNRRVLQTT